MVAAAIKPGQDHAPDPFDIYSATFRLSAVTPQTLDLAQIALSRLVNANHKKPVLGFVPGEPVREFIKSIGPNVPGGEKFIAQGWMTNMEPDQGPGRKPFRSEWYTGGGVGDEVARCFNRPGIARLDLQVAAPVEKLDSSDLLPYALRIQLQSTLDTAKSEIDKANQFAYPIISSVFIRWMPNNSSDKNTLTAIGMLVAPEIFYQLR